MCVNTEEIMKNKNLFIFFHYIYYFKIIWSCFQFNNFLSCLVLSCILNYAMLRTAKSQKYTTYILKKYKKILNVFADLQLMYILMFVFTYIKGKYVSYSNFTTSTFLFYYWLFYCIFQGCSCREGNKKNLKVHDHKNQNLWEETVWCPW